MGRNRVGVAGTDHGGAVLEDAVGGARGVVDEHAAVEENAALAQKRLRIQKELLRKKKAERRAHAKQRKAPAGEPPKEADAEPQAGDAVSPAVETRPTDDLPESERRPTDVVALENDSTFLAAMQPKSKAKKTTTKAARDDADEVAPQEEVLKTKAKQFVGDAAALERRAAVAPNETAERVVSESPQDERESDSKPTIVARASTPLVRPALLDDPVADTRTPLASPQQHASSTSLPSEAATLSIGETDEATQPQDEGVELHPKKVKKPSSSPEDCLSDDAAATTIQKALKKRLVKQTKRTLSKAKSLIRHSSKVLAEETSSEPLQPVASTRPAIVPPLLLKPRPPLPSSPPASSQGEESSSSRSSSSRASSSRRTISHRFSSSSSRVSSSRSWSDSSSSPSSRSRSRSPSLKRSTSKKTRGPHRESRQDKLRTSGPSVEMLLPSMPHEEPDAAARPRRFGELHAFMATRIQARVRGMRGRHFAHQRAVEFDQEIRDEALREILVEASVRIQAHIKGFLERRRLGVDEDKTAAARRRSRHHHRRHHAKPNSVVPQCLVDANGQRVREADADAAAVCEWPEEFNLECIDDWDELNSVGGPRGVPVTTSRFLSRGKLRVFCGTWNLHATRPTDDLRLWIAPNRYHIVAVGTEECVNSIAKSVVFTSKKQWEDQLKETLGDEYVLVAAHALTAIHNAVFVHESVLPFVQHIQSDAVATGLGNQLGNKGGVGVAFSVGATSFAFVNCHFDAHQHNVAKRNANFHRINQELRLFPLRDPSVSPLHGLGKTTTSRFSSSGASSSLAAGSSSSATGTSGSTSSFRRRKLAVAECFDRVFWFGDLNYRVNGTRRMIDLLLLHNQHAVLRFNDQLQREMHKGNVFAHFREGPLHFRPTYKLDRHSDVYDSGPKQRIPSWTDRVLYLSNEKPHDVELLSYRSHMHFRTSDHRPVGAVFEVNFDRGAAHAKEDEAAAAQPQGGGGTGAGVGGARAGGGEQEFARVLARGYKPSQSRSEVCVVQ